MASAFGSHLVHVILREQLEDVCYVQKNSDMVTELLPRHPGKSTLQFPYKFDIRFVQIRVKGVGFNILLFALGFWLKCKLSL
jgi:hypothetical protein